VDLARLGRVSHGCRAAVAATALMQWAKHEIEAPPGLFRRRHCLSLTDACSMAARGGHLEALKWLHAHGAPWNEQTCASAVRGGHLKVFRWLREHGCPW